MSQASNSTTQNQNQVMDLIKNSGGNAQRAFLNLAKEKGMNEEQIAGFLNNAMSQYKSLNVS